MTDNEEILIKDLKAHLSEGRFIHSVNVARSAVQLAECYGGNVKSAHLAGLMHDVLKELDRESSLKFFADNHIILTDIELNAPKLWHAMSGAEYLRITYGFTPETVSAVRYHTTGRHAMTKLEKIIFIADFISADRDYDGVEEMRRRAEISLEFAMEEGLRFTIDELCNRLVPVHPDTLDAYNDICLEKINGRK